MINYEKKTLGALETLCGTLSQPSKMPCYGYSLPASRCKIGSLLRAKSKDSTCADCYALKGRYVFPNVQIALEKRYNCLTKDLERWKSALCELIRRREKSGYFRFHDSGDIQSAAHLNAIFDICEELPQIKFWLPTREFSIVNKVCAYRMRPSNLTIRLSAYMKKAPPPYSVAKQRGLVCSTVDYSDEETAQCNAPKQGGRCESCRACWDPTVFNVNYATH